MSISAKETDNGHSLTHPDSITSEEVQSKHFPKFFEPEICRKCSAMKAFSRFPLCQEGSLAAGAPVSPENALDLFVLAGAAELSLEQTERARSVATKHFFWQQ